MSGGPAHGPRETRFTGRASCAKRCGWFGTLQLLRTWRNSWAAAGTSLEDTGRCLPILHLVLYLERVHGLRSSLGFPHSVFEFLSGLRAKRSLCFRASVEPMEVVCLEIQLPSFVYCTV